MVLLSHLRSNTYVCEKWTHDFFKIMHKKCSSGCAIAHRTNILEITSDSPLNSDKNRRQVVVSFYECLIIERFSQAKLLAWIYCTVLKELLLFEQCIYGSIIFRPDLLILYSNHIDFHLGWKYYKK